MKKKNKNLEKLELKRETESTRFLKRIPNFNVCVCCLRRNESNPTPSLSSIFSFLLLSPIFHFLVRFLSFLLLFFHLSFSFLIKLLCWLPGKWGKIRHKGEFRFLFLCFLRLGSPILAVLLNLVK